jgi:biopolymer transport protein ExbD
MKRSQHGEVELPITPMLDMAFQLLTFFILTYTPAPTEGQFSMNLLPAAPVLDTNAPPPDANAPSRDDIPASLRTLTTIVRAGPKGEISQIRIGDVDVNGAEGLKERLKQIKADATPFDQALIRAEPTLKYEALIQIVDIFSQADITKISFSEIDLNAPGAAL